MAKANVLEYAKIFQSTLDKQVEQESTTGWMEANATQVKYNGGNEIKMPTLIMDGLADYDRTSGFVDGAVTLTYKTYELTQDRGRSFSLDAMDVDETNFLLTAGNVTGEFQRVHVIPEVDAYRYSKLATLAVDAGQTKDLAVTKENIVSALQDDLIKMEDVIGAKDVVITMSAAKAGLLGVAGKDFISKAMLAKGALSVEVQTFNDNAIVKAPSKLLKTEFEFTDDGFEAGAGAKNINWLITTKDAPIAISKTDKVRIFSPIQNLNMDAWKIDFRKYHDLWVPESKLTSIYANLEA